MLEARRIIEKHSLEEETKLHKQLQTTMYVHKFLSVSLTTQYIKNMKFQSRSFDIINITYNSQML